MTSFTCVYCGEAKTVKGKEHVIPESLGGTLIIEDVCRDCNSTLGHSIDAEFVDSDYMRMVRFSQINYLPSRAIPEFRFDAVLISPDKSEEIPGYIRFSSKGIEFQQKFHKQTIGNETRYYIPDTKEGRKAFEGLRNSKKAGIQKSEWTDLPPIPEKIVQPMELWLPYSKEIFKMFLGYLAFAISPEYALDSRFDPIRDYIKPETSDLGQEPYTIRTSNTPEAPHDEEAIYHEIGFRVSDGYCVFYVILFDCQLFEIDVSGRMPILPEIKHSIKMEKKRETLALDFLKFGKAITISR